MYPHATPFSSIENGSFYRWIIAFFTQTNNPKWKQNWALLSSFSLSPNGQSAGTELKYQTRFKPPSHFIQSSPQFQLEERSYRKSKPNERNTWAGSDRNHFRAVRRNSIRLLWIFHIILFSFPIRLCTTAVRLTTHPFDGLAAPSGKVDRQKNEQTFGRMDGQTDRQTDGRRVCLIPTFHEKCPGTLRSRLSKPRKRLWHAIPVYFILCRRWKTSGNRLYVEALSSASYYLPLIVVICEMGF